MTQDQLNQLLDFALAKGFLSATVGMAIEYLENGDTDWALNVLLVARAQYPETPDTDNEGATDE